MCNSSKQGKGKNSSRREKERILLREKKSSLFSLCKMMSQARQTCDWRRREGGRERGEEEEEEEFGKGGGVWGKRTGRTWRETCTFYFVLQVVFNVLRGL